MSKRGVVLNSNMKQSIAYVTLNITYLITGNDYQTSIDPRDMIWGKAEPSTYGDCVMASFNKSSFIWEWHSVDCDEKHGVYCRNGKYRLKLIINEYYVIYKEK